MPFERILVAIDGSQPSDHAFTKAVEPASSTNARLHALAVEGRSPPLRRRSARSTKSSAKRMRFGALCTRARKEAEAAGVAIEVELRPGHAAGLIASVAEETGADLIVLDHRGHFLRDHLLGSTADRVAEHAPCPVMIVR